jgi:hypothetical protein
MRHKLPHPAIKSALIYLASCCDGGSPIDGAGFNKIDTEFGKDLAENAQNDRLTPKQQLAAQRLLKKYQRQLKTQGIKLPTIPELEQYLEVLEVSKLPNGRWRVINWGKDTEYEVSLSSGGFWDCTCPFHQAKDINCKHIRAVFESGEWGERLEEVAQQQDPEIDNLHEEPVDLIHWKTKLPLAIAEKINAGQKLAIAKLCDFLALPIIEGKPSFLLLEGRAGTGKTFTISVFLKLILSQKLIDLDAIAVAAPTNKAVKAIKSALLALGLSLKCQTIYRLLGLKLEVDDDGKEKVSADRYTPSTISDYELVIVDECSMINKDIWQSLNAALKSGKTKAIFMGDAYQLPPVGELTSRTFEAIPNRIELTQVMRFGSAIGELVEKTFESIYSVRAIAPYSISSPDASESVEVLQKSVWLDRLVADFLSEEYRANPDYVRAIAWRNEVVNWLNQYVRTKRYGESANQFVIGERLIANKPVLDVSPLGKRIILNTSEECEVFEAFKGEYLNYKCWELWITSESGNRYKVRCLDSAETQRFNAALERLKKEAWSFERGSEAAKSVWRKYFELRGTFASLNYCYAITCHKAQGSTFTNVYVAYQDLLQNSKSQERNQLIYVAFSRAANKLIISQ